jgi:hypothetical protein
MTSTACSTADSRRHGLSPFVSWPLSCFRSPHCSSYPSCPLHLIIASPPLAYLILVLVTDHSSIIPFPHYLQLTATSSPHFLSCPLCSLVSRLLLFSSFLCVRFHLLVCCVPRSTFRILHSIFRFLLLCTQPVRSSHSIRRVPDHNHTYTSKVIVSIV